MVRDIYMCSIMTGSIVWSRRPAAEELRGLSVSDPGCRWHIGDHRDRCGLWKNKHLGAGARWGDSSWFGLN